MGFTPSIETRQDTLKIYTFHPTFTFNHAFPSCFLGSEGTYIAKLYACLLAHWFGPIMELSWKIRNLSLCSKIFEKLQRTYNFGGDLLSEDDHSFWVPPYWNITKETFFWVELKSKYNCKN